MLIKLEFSLLFPKLALLQISIGGCCKDIVLTKIVQFYNWLKTDYQKRSRGKGEHVPVGKGVSDKLAHGYVCAIRMELEIPEKAKSGLFRASTHPDLGH